MYDIDNKTPQVSDDDFLGQIECTLGEVWFYLHLFAYHNGETFCYSLWSCDVSHLPLHRCKLDLCSVRLLGKIFLHVIDTVDSGRSTGHSLPM